MPKISDINKDYVIESESDIPEKYRKEIEKRLSSGTPTNQMETSEIVSGKRGKVVSNEDEIEDIFKNEQDFYFGHGTSGGEDVISSILENGLMTVNPEAIKAYGNTLRGLDSTTIAWGNGTDNMYSEQKDLLDNWPHKGSKNVIIISLPEKYTLRNTEVGLSDLYAPFYTGSKEEGFKLRPEFIKGIYNADSHTFIQNNNFYQNIEIEQQEKLFQDIRQQYIRLYSEYSNVAPDKVQKDLPLNKIEIEQVEIEWYKNQLERFRRDKTFDVQELDTELHEMSEGYKISDFNNTTNSIRKNIQREMEADKKNTEEEWLLDDW